MKLKSLTLTCCLVAVPALSLAASRPVEPFELLKDVRSLAYDTANHASELQSLTRSPSIAWQTHVNQWILLKDDVNTMAGKLAELEKVRDSVAPEEQKAIDEATAQLRTMAANTQAGVNFVKDTNELWKPAYQKYVDSLADESKQLATSLDRFVQLAQARTKEKHLEKELGMAAGS